MEQNYTNPTRKNEPGVKLIAIAGIVLMMTFVVSVVLISSLSGGLPLLGGLSGRYEYNAYIETLYIEFKGGNKIAYGAIDGHEYAATYTLDGNQITIKTDDTIFGINLFTLKGTVSDNKREIVLAGMTFTKK